MKSRYVYLSLIIFSFVSVFLSPNVLTAVSPTDLQQQIDKVMREREVLVEEQKKLQAELEKVNRESQTLGSAVKSLDTTRRKLATDINLTQSKITSTGLTIKSLENTMTEKEQQIAIHRRAIAETLLALSEHDTRPFLLNLLASAQLSDIWGDKNRLENLTGKLEDEINNLRETRKVLDREKGQKEKIKQEQESLQDQLSGQKSVVEENKKAKEKLLAQTKSKEAEYQKLLAENIANQKQFEADLFRLESELKITIDPSSIPSAKPGILVWPLSSITVTQPFGDTSFSRAGGYNGKGHNGVDLKASQGTPVKSMLSGVVQGMGNTDEMNSQLRQAGKSVCGSYGRWMLIRHDNGLSSLYAHLSAIIVQPGQNVSTGEIIGYSGGQPGVNGSGYSTGPHLHVGLFASQGVQITKFSTSINCKHTSVPIADPKAYLNPLSYLPTI
jgi:murein DD-endopeptidase MepM/ murein hydrolase activator NlpD